MLTEQEIIATGGRTVAEEREREAAIARGVAQRQRQAAIETKAATSKPAPPVAPETLERAPGLSPKERGFTPPEGSKPVEWAWLPHERQQGESIIEFETKPDKSRPTVYEGKDGVRYYTPDSPMWDLGFRTGGVYNPETKGIEYKTGSAIQGEFRGGATSEIPLVAIDTPEGVKHITQAEAIKFSKLKGEDLFDEMVLQGLIPKGSTFTPAKVAKVAEVAVVAKPVSVQANLQKYMVDDKTINLTQAVAAGFTKTSDFPGFDVTQTELNRIIKQQGEVKETKDRLKEHITGSTLNLTDAIKAGHINVTDYAGFDVTQPEIDKVVANQAEIADAKKQLKWANITGDMYRLPDILVSDDARDRKAAEVLFDAQAIKKGEKWIDKNWGPTERGVLLVKPSTTLSEYWRKVTPWQEEKGETVISELTKLKKKAIGILPPGLAGIVPAAGVVATAEPTPVGEVILAVLLAGGAAYSTLKVSQRKNAEEKATLSNSVFKATYGRDMALSDIVLVNEKGQPASLAEILPALGLTDAQRELLKLPPSKVKPGLPKLEGFEQTADRLKDMLKLPSIKVGAIETPGEVVKVDTKAKELGKVSPFFREPTIVIPGIGDVPKELSQSERFIYGKLTAEDLRLRASELKSAEQKLKTTIKTMGPEDLGITEAEFNRVLKIRLTEALEKPAGVKKVNWDAITGAIKRGEAAEIVRKARENDQRILALVQQALVRHQAMASYNNLVQKYSAYLKSAGNYIESMNPMQISGSEVPSLDATFASFTLARDLSLPRPKGAESLSSYIDSISVPVTTQALDDLLTRTFLEARTDGATETQATTQALQALKTATKTATTTATKEATSTKAATAIKTATTTAAGAVTPAIATTATTAMGDTAKTTTGTSTIIRLPKGASDKEKRKAISKSEGAIGWRQGELGGEDVWHILIFPYQSEKDYLTVLGRKPPNTTLVKGPGSAYQTVKLVYGKPPSRKVTGDIGFMDFFIEPKSGNRIGIGFMPDPKRETTGDITIGQSKKMPPITEKPPRLTARNLPRITPRRPRLR